MTQAEVAIFGLSEDEHVPAWAPCYISHGAVSSSSHCRGVKWRMGGWFDFEVRASSLLQAYYCNPGKFHL